jgi:hydrogenase-4 component F
VTASLPWLLLVCALATALACALSPSARLREIVHLVGTALTTAVCLWLVQAVLRYGDVFAGGRIIFVDPLGAVVLLIIALVSTVAAVQSIGYMRVDRREHTVGRGQERLYYSFFHLFVAAMYVVPLANNLGVAWVAIEATTVASAVLVALYRNKESLEAAWKYLVLCSVGIAFALLGLTLLYGAAVGVYGPGDNRLDFTFLARVAHTLSPPVALLSFALVLVGYGTKVGLAPLHFWLPDAHSQAPSPISGMLSGALLNVGLYGILRLLIIVDHLSTGLLANHLCIAFGLLSMAVAFPFVLLQQDIKRMLAYSSVEQMGILLFGVGLGGPLALLAVILQMFSHALVKSTLFMAAGNLSQQYGTKRIQRITAALRGSPMTGLLLLIGGLELVGAPPFALFTSEFSLTVAGFGAGDDALTVVFLLLLAALFGATLYQIGRMAFGADVGRTLARRSAWTTWPLVVPVAIAACLGIYVPGEFALLAHSAAAVLGGRML